MQIRIYKFLELFESYSFNFEINPLCTYVSKHGIPLYFSTSNNTTEEIKKEFEYLCDNNPKFLSTMKKLNTSHIMFEYLTLTLKFFRERRSKKIYLKELAKSVNISAKTIQRFENFERLITIDTLLTLLKALDIKLF